MAQSWSGCGPKESFVWVKRGWGGSSALDGSFMVACKFFWVCGNSSY